MSVRVNLLPREAEERERERRARVGLLLGAIVLLVILGGLYFLQLSRVDDANERLQAAQDEVARLQEEVDSLAAYAELEQRRATAIQLVQATMATDVTFAGILQDIAAVMPSEAALLTLGVTIGEAPEAPQEFDLGGPSFGTLNLTGETLRGHAPGVERLLLEVDKVAAFFNVFVTTSTLDEEDVTTFTVDTSLGPEVFTGRYLEGLPEDLR